MHIALRYRKGKLTTFIELYRKTKDIHRQHSINPISSLPYLLLLKFTTPDSKSIVIYMYCCPSSIS